MTSLRAGLAVLAFATSLYGQATYYVAPTGNDANTGTTRTHAWRTLAHDLHAGDTLLLEGGSTFSGSIRVRADNVTIASYGKGKAVIDSGSNTAIDASGVSGLHITNVALRGTSLATNLLDRSGIEIANRGVKQHGVTIDHVDISGYALAGIVFYATDRISGVDDITIDSVNIHDVGYVGIAFYDFENGAYHNVSIRHSDFSNVTGYINAYGVVVQGTGSGILAQGIVTGTIANNHIHDSGTLYGGGGAAIALTTPTDVTIEENELHGMQSVVNLGAGGIDVDGGASVHIRYNYIHDNEGPAVHLCGCVTPLHEAEIHHNLIENGGIDIEGGVVVDSVNVFHNTIFAGDGTAVRATGLISAFFANNLLLTNHGIAVDASNGATFLGNDYFDYSGTLLVTMSGSDPQALFADPQLIAVGTAGTLFPAALSDADVYRFTPNSPLIDRAADLTSQGVQIGLRDYYGGVERTLFGSDIGAYEFRPEPYAPSIDPIASQHVEVGDSIDVDVWLRDPDGTRDVTVILVNAPPFATLRRVGGGHAIVTLAPVAGGQTTITVRATDSAQLSDQKSFVVTATGATRTRAVRRR